MHKEEDVARHRFIQLNGADEKRSLETYKYGGSRKSNKRVGQ